MDNEKATKDQECTHDEFAPKIENMNCQDCQIVLASQRYLDQCKKCTAYYKHLQDTNEIEIADMAFQITKRKMAVFQCLEILPSGKSVLLTELFTTTPKDFKLNSLNPFRPNN